MNEPRSGLKIEENVRLAPLTTLGVGGAARFFARAENDADVVKAIGFAREHDFPLFVLGGGSNVLVADRGFDGLVLQIAGKGVAVGREEAGRVPVTAQAGEDWDEFVAFSVAGNLAGLECLSGIPGWVGGTPVQNVGAYGQEVAETIRAVRVYDRKSGEFLELSNADCRFAYRQSIFNGPERDRFVVLAVTYALVPNGAPKIVYRDLVEHFGGRAPNLAETRAAVCEIRAAKAMLVRQGGPDAASAGSFFKNPIVSRERFAAVAEEAVRLGLARVPSYPAGDDACKIPAAWLIEQSGFPKGFRKGRAGLSTRHTLALTNRGEATAAELVALKNEIQTTVKKRFGVELETEPVMIGFTH